MHRPPPGLSRQLELYGSAGLLLQDHRSGGCEVAVAHIADSETNEVAAAELAIDPEVEEGQVAYPLLKLQARADGPDITDAERRLLADQLALVPR